MRVPPSKAIDPARFNLPALRDGLRPFRLHYFPRLRSTNDHAAALRKRGTLFAPAVVLTANQTAGRGRGGNTWWSRRGSLTVTFVLPVDERLEPHQVPLLAGLAVRSAAAELAGGTDIQLKWPNDILHEDRKLGGLLCERVMGVDLIGLGLNVNLDAKQAPMPLRNRITSISQIRGSRLDMSEALLIVVSHLRIMLRRAIDRPFAALLREYDSHHALIGRKVCVTVGGNESPVCGICKGLDGMGRLTLRARGRTHHLIAGQVQAI